VFNVFPSCVFFERMLSDGKGGYDGYTFALVLGPLHFMFLVANGFSVTFRRGLC
jgi:hypothetical protein